MSQYFGQMQDLPIDPNNYINDSTKQIIFGPDGRFWEDYVMRLFTLEPGAENSIHSHPWCHWFLCIQGEGYFNVDSERAQLTFGTWVHVPSGVRHSFGNTSKTEKLMGICIVPKEGDVNPLIGC